MVARQNRGLDGRPVGRVLDPVRRRPRLRAEQVAVRHDVAQRFEHVEPIVDEMGDAQLARMHGLVDAAQAEAPVGRRDAGVLEEPVVGQPLLGAPLDPFAALGDQSHPAVEQLDKPGQDVEDAVHRRCGEHRLLVDPKNPVSAPSGSSGPAMTTRPMSTPSRGCEFIGQ